jgi:hypothetical protein
LRNFPCRALLLASVKVSEPSRHQFDGSRFAAVAVMFLLWVAMCALEVSPELHHRLHKDSHSAGHTCLVTQLQHHQVLSGFVPAIAPALPEVSSTQLSCGDFQFRPAYDYRLTPSRGPPAV